MASRDTGNAVAGHRLKSGTVREGIWFAFNLLSYCVNFVLSLETYGYQLSRPSYSLLIDMNALSAFHM